MLLTSLGIVVLLAQGAVVVGLMATLAERLYVGALIYLLLVGAANFILLLLEPGQRAA